MLLYSHRLSSFLQPARVALSSGCEGVAAINTIMSVMGINLNNLRPEPCVEGFEAETSKNISLFFTASFISGKFMCLNSLSGTQLLEAILPRQSILLRLQK